MQRFSILLALLLVALVCGQQRCTRDYSCGNIPYRYCNGGTDDCANSAFELAVDDVKGAVYYFQTDCKSGPKVFPLQKLSSTTAPSAPLYVANLDLSYGTYITKILTVVGEHVYLQVSYKSLPYQGLRYLNLTEGGVLYNSDAYLYHVINIVGDQGVADYYGRPAVRLFSGFSADRSVFVKEIYRFVQADGSTVDSLTVRAPLIVDIKRVGNDLYIATVWRDNNVNNQVSVFYKGTVACENCTLAETSGFVSFPGQVVTGMEINTSGPTIYWSDSTGALHQMDASGGNQRTLPVNGPVQGFRFSQQQNRIFYNNGAQPPIRAINADGTNDQSWVLDTQGVCTCRPGFTGNSCQTCTGQTQWDTKNLPACVAVNANGVPASCSQDYQCGSPFYQCAGTCVCRPNFTGDQCNQCAAPRSVKWENGSPVCA